ncbi:MAG: GGDEF domain-containing protein [Gammaproteobacteria bacterium]|nr:GGDEF domain-containing protein [Gammaproteobacteria bacterium]
MEIFEQLLEDYAVDTNITPQALQDKIGAGLVYWADLNLQSLEIDVEPTNNGRINKTAAMQNLLTVLSQLILEDSLTGLFNRRYFKRALKSEMERNVREHRPVGLAVIDIDHFKRINDTWGHDGGDKVLKAVTMIMNRNVRQSDTLIRIGGEEFAVVMPNIRHQAAGDAMERLRADIANSIIPVNSDELRTSVSIGIAVREPNQIIHADELYKQADQALYQAKETGRNKVVLYGPPASTGLSASEREALL